MQPALARLRRTRETALIDARPAAVLAVLVVAAAAVRALLATQIATPWIFVDELVHSDLARASRTAKVSSYAGSM